MVRESAPPLVKICGNQSPADVIAAARSGADFVGIIFADSPRKVTVQTARAMVRELGSPLNRHELVLPPPMMRGDIPTDELADWCRQGTERLMSYLSQKRPLVVGVFANQHPDEVNAITEETGVDLVQLSGTEPWDDSLLINRQIIKAVHVAARTDGQELLSNIPSQRSLLIMLDSKDEERFGGTGKKIPFETSRQISMKIPIMLAGGLTPDNVSEVVKEVNPWAVDVSSGTETDGNKDYMKVASFIAAAKSLW